MTMQKLQILISTSDTKCSSLHSTEMPYGIHGVFLLPSFAVSQSL